jgi:hypothetical protein
MRDRFLRDRLPVRLGHVASNLARLGDWAEGEHSEQALIDLMREIAHQLEWSGDSGLAELADMQREVCFWRRAFPATAGQAVVASRARDMSDRLLKLSGLLDAPDRLREG